MTHIALAIFESLNQGSFKIEDGNTVRYVAKEYSIPTAPVWIRKGNRIVQL